MTHEERAKWIKRIFVLVLAAVVVAGVFLYPKPKPKVEKVKEVEVPVIQDDGVELVLYYQPGGTGSEQLSATLDRVAVKYGKQAIVQKVDAKTHPEKAKAQGVSKLPHVIIYSKAGKAFEFQGNWTQVQVEGKVEEILRGLKRVGKDWRPTVPGMTPASSAH